MPSTDITYCTREEIIKAIKKLGEMPKERPSIEEIEKNMELCKKPIEINWEAVKEWGINNVR